MRIHLLSKNTVEKYIDKNKQSEVPLKSWLESLRNADWAFPQEILRNFNSADLLGRKSKRVVFNIGGNKYRIICQYHFGKSKVRLFVNWIGTHAEYSKLCKAGKQYTIDEY